MKPDQTSVSSAAEPESAGPATSRRDPPPAALRALAEAEERRRRRPEIERPAELNGRGGLDPARYGDWEIKGIACDF